MEEIRICPICKKEFKAAGNKKYCGKECFEEGNRRGQAKRRSERRQREQEKRLAAAAKAKKESPLQEMARKAREAGMSYGQYVVLKEMRRNQKCQT